MNIKLIGIFFIWWNLISCQIEQVENIEIKSIDEYLSIKEGIKIYYGENLLEDKSNKTYKIVNISDTIKFSLSEEEKELINKSFIKEKIYNFIDKEQSIGEIDNMIRMPKTIEIRTNKRNILVKYRYFFNDQKSIIDKDKTKRFNKFMRAIDSIIYYKKIYKENNIFKKR